jgi:hypothetical protein
MSSYNKTERLLAKLLEEFPIVRQFAKYMYQRLMYVLNYSSNDLILSNGYTLIDPFLEIKGETFFGYYDKPSINMRGDILTHKVDKNVCSIYVKKLAGKLIKISNTNAWNWQQGAMATWLDDEHIAYNDIVDDMVVCCIYSLEQKKVIHKHKYAMQCYSPVNKLYVSVTRCCTLHIVGDGPTKEFLEDEAIKLPKHITVKFHGRVSDKDLDKIYAEADLYVACAGRYKTTIEGFGLTIIEAASFGVPVLAFDVDGAGEVARMIKASVVDSCISDISKFIEEFSIELYRYQLKPKEILALFSPERQARDFNELLHES